MCFPDGSSAGTAGAVLASGLDQIHGLCTDDAYMYVVQAGMGTVVRLRCPDVPGVLNTELGQRVINMQCDEMRAKQRVESREKNMVERL